MTTLLEKALEKVAALSQEDQDAVAAQILADLEDEALWKEKLEAGSAKLNAMAEDATSERTRGEARPLEEIL